MQHPTEPARRPGTLTAAAVIAAAQGFALVVWGIFMIIEAVFGDPDDPVQAIAGGLVVLALASLPLIAARGLARGRRFGRGPALIIQLIALPIAWTMASSGGALIVAGVALGTAALAELVLLLNPRTTATLGGPAPRAPDD